MSTRRILVPFFLVSLALASCSSQPTQATGAEVEAEANRAFNQMAASMPLVADRETIDFVACVAQAVVEVLEPPYNDIDWSLRVFENESVNAFAMPGGKIGVFSGLLKVTANEHQLAAVIGHEIAHVTAEHSLERAGRACYPPSSLRELPPAWRGAFDARGGEFCLRPEYKAAVRFAAGGPGKWGRYIRARKVWGR